MYVYFDDRLTSDRPTTDLSFRKISNGHIAATGRLIHSMYGSRVGFSGTADLVALFLLCTASLLAFGDNITSHHC